MHSFWKDLRFAVRTSLKAPVATFVAILALAFGIGVNVSAFIAVNGVILHPMPFANLERIETIWQTSPKTHLDRQSLSTADFVDLEKQSSSFESLAACRSIAGTVQEGATPEMVRIAQVSAKFFTVLSGKAARGRVAPMDLNTAVVSEAFWKARLGGAADVVGRRLRLGSGTATIIGVMPDNFDYPLGTEVWSPLVPSPADTQRHNVHDLQVIGLRRSTVTSNQSAAELSAIAARLAVAFPDTNRDQTLRVIALRDLSEGITNRFITVILGAAGFVLLLACANIGNLQLARATHRQKEIALRAALGASRFQIGRHLLAESLLISVGAGCLGVLLADWNNVFSKQNIPAMVLRIVPGLRTMTVDPGVLVFALIVSILAGVTCSVPAILHLLRGAAYDNLDESLRERSAVGAQHSSGLFRSSLVVSELALALVLLIGAGLMVGTFHRLLDLNQGFNPKNVLMAEVSLPQSSYSDAARRLAYYDRALTELGQLPGVGPAALSAHLGTPAYFAIEGRPEHRSGEPLPDMVATSSRYLESLRIPMLEGRSIAASDVAQAARVMVLSKTLAHFYWPTSSAIGQRIKLEQGGEWFTIIGVSADVIDDWFSGKPSSLAYVSYAQNVPASATFLIRTQAEPLSLAPAVRERFQVIDSAVPLLDLNSMEKALSEERAGVRAAASTMSTYAAIALLLAITGIYAVVSYLVSMRTRDIGVHMALGATRGDVLKMMTGQTGKLILLGVGGGLLLSVLLTRMMAHFLFDVVQLDAMRWVELTLLLLAAAFLAACFPAMRATRIDPISALRHD